MLYYVLVFLSFMQSVVGFTLMSTSLMRIKEPAKKHISIGFLVMFTGIVLLSYALFSQGSEQVSRNAILYILVIQISWFLICSKDRFFISLFNFLTFANVYLSISYISDNLSYGFSGNAFIGSRIAIRAIIYIIILPLLFKYVRPRFRMLVETLDKEWRAAGLAPLLFFVMQIMILYYPSPYWSWNNDHWFRYIIPVVYLLFLTVYYLLHIQANALVEKYTFEKRQLLMTQQEKLWESELSRQKEEATLAKRQKHDMHHHNAVIMGLLQNDEKDHLLRYMESFDATLDTHCTSLFCNNPIANSILNLYANRAEQDNIKTEFNVNIPESIGIDSIDLTCVLGNALENALEGCLRLPADEEKEIIVTAKYFDRRLRLQVENTCLSDITFEDELPKTQKQGGGTGTRSIVYTAERYDGTAGFSVANGKFITQVVLNAH